MSPLHLACTFKSYLANALRFCLTPARSRAFWPSYGRLFIAPLASALVLAAPLGAAQTFTDVTNASGVAHSSETYGASWGDVNGDGYPDLFVSNHRTMKSLFKNKGDGTF